MLNTGTRIHHELCSGVMVQKPRRVMWVARKLGRVSGAKKKGVKWVDPGAKVQFVVGGLN